MRSSTIAPLIAALPLALAAPQQPEFTNTTTLPTNFGLLVFPHFQALDVFGPMDVFNTLSMLYANNTKMQLSILSTTMEPVSTGMKAMAGMNSFGESIMPTITFKDYLAAKNMTSVVGQKGERKENCDDGKGGHAVAKRHEMPGMPGHDMPDSEMPGHAAPAMVSDIEVLIVPGGGGTRQNMTEEIDFIKQLYPKLKYIISVCTGSTVLARAGILDGKRATTNKRAWPWAISTGPKVTWVPTARWVEDGNIFTSSGISAGIDVAYAYVSRVYGAEVADYLSKSAEYSRTVEAGNDPYAKIWDVPGS